MSKQNRKIATLCYSRGAVVKEHHYAVLGHKLDNVRHIIAHSYPNTWAHNFWTQVEQQLLRKYKMLNLH